MSRKSVKNSPTYQDADFLSFVLPSEIGDFRTTSQAL